MTGCTEPKVSPVIVSAQITPASFRSLDSVRLRVVAFNRSDVVGTIYKMDACFQPYVVLGSDGSQVSTPYLEYCSVIAPIGGPQPTIQLLPGDKYEIRYKFRADKLGLASGSYSVQGRIATPAGWARSAPPVPFELFPQDPPD